MKDFIAWLIAAIVIFINVSIMMHYLLFG